MLEDLIITLDELNEKPAAISLLDALGRHSYQVEQYDELARCWFKLKQYHKALDLAEKTLSMVTGDSYAAKYNVINVANHANYPDRAMVLIQQLELLNRGDIDLKLEKAFSLFLLNRKDEAEKLLREELANPDNSEEMKIKIRFNLGTYELMRDEFQSGLRKFLFEGRKLDYWKKPELPFTRWEGEDIPKGSKIIVRAEAGIGDEFVNVRFMNHLRRLGLHPIWFTDRQDMADIFNRNGYDCVTNLEQLNETDYYWVHSMDLPVYLNLSYETLFDGPYLSADPGLVDKYREILNSDKPKIGLRWQGNPSYDQDLHRSIPLPDLYNITHSYGTLYSIQRDTGLEDIGTRNIIDLNEYLTDFEQTLAIIENLDLVITSCTSVGHAAAALGKETILFTPISSYYTWCHTTEKSPWYGDNLTILRQVKPRCWAAPMKQLKELLLDKFS